MQPTADASQLSTPAARRPRRAVVAVIRTIAVALALLGWWLSFDLLRMTLPSADPSSGRATNPWLASQCGEAGGAGSASDCLSVLRSDWAYTGGGAREGSAPRGLPWAAWGAGYFAFVALWYAFVGPPDRTRWYWHLVMLAVVATGVLVSAHLLVVMASVLRTWCVGCAAAHVINGLLALLTLAAFPWRPAIPGSPARPPASAALATMVAGALVLQVHLLAAGSAGLAAAASAYARAYRDIVDDPHFAQWKYTQQPQIDLPLRDDEAFLGDPAAARTVLVYTDFRCPRCRDARDVLTKLVADHPDRLRVALRHFPLDPDCNPSASMIHPGACAAARAAEAARAVGGPSGFLRMAALLHERFGRIEAAPLVEWAVELGFDRAAFEDAMRSQAVADRIAADVEDHQRHFRGAGVPIVLLDGRRVEFWQVPQAWAALLGVD